VLVGLNESGLGIGRGEDLTIELGPFEPLAKGPADRLLVIDDQDSLGRLQFPRHGGAPPSLAPQIMGQALRRLGASPHYFRASKRKGSDPLVFWVFRGSDPFLLDALRRLYIRVSGPPGRAMYWRQAPPKSLCKRRPSAHKRREAPSLRKASAPAASALARL